MKAWVSVIGLLLALSAVASAFAPFDEPWVSVVDARTGAVQGNVVVDGTYWSRDELRRGQEVPYYPGTWPMASGTWPEMPVPPKAELDAKYPGDGRLVEVSSAGVLVYAGKVTEPNQDFPVSMGDLLLCSDPRQGPSRTLRTLLHDVSMQPGDGRELHFKPAVAFADPWLLVDEGHGIRAVDVTNGQTAWSVTDRRLVNLFGLNGAWRIGDTVYVDTSKGLTAVRRGQVAWTQPDIQTVESIGLRDGRLYVKHNPPERMLQELHADGATAHMSAYGQNVFASTRDAQGDEVVWERKGDHWSRVFSYPAGMPVAKLDGLYARYGFSSRMRKALDLTH